MGMVRRTNQGTKDFVHLKVHRVGGAGEPGSSQLSGLSTVCEAAVMAVSTSSPPHTAAPPPHPPPRSPGSHRKETESRPRSAALYRSPLWFYPPLQ
ncbi:hypothetical protein GDO78_017836 [Eleutherodactylus coqui]|uniref:Uncharacterized protein n=1 Tax=Eleutherodactylus coqui TaxID=57060 RepID=A0A8J6BDS2_ELECQ|nr:hypothetical protein GDO78_017836 [Eleutherodactylus coqui]